MHFISTPSFCFVFVFPIIAFDNGYFLPYIKLLVILFVKLIVGVDFAIMTGIDETMDEPYSPNLDCSAYTLKTPEFSNKTLNVFPLNQKKGWILVLLY